MKSEGEGLKEQDNNPRENNPEREEGEPGGDVGRTAEEGGNAGEQTVPSGEVPPPPVYVTVDPTADSPGKEEKAVIDGEEARDIPDHLGLPKFKLFTKESYARVQFKYEEFKRKQQEKKDNPAEGRLVDGELKFGDDDDDEPLPERNPLLMEGSTFPEYLEPHFPKELTGKAIEEIDQYLNDKTFVVISRRFSKKYIHRFSANKGLFCLSPWSPIRRTAVAIATNQFFDLCIILTILLNCVFLVFKENEMTAIAEYVFLGIYTTEMIIKVLARGFIMNTFTYLRDGWNWLDFLVIISAWLTLFMMLANSQVALSDISILRTLRVFRAFKTISIVPGLKTIISALFKSMRMLAEVILLTLFCMMVFALFALQVYIGILRQKCVKDIPETNPPYSHAEYLTHIKNSENWMLDAEGDYLICGNATGAGGCPTNYTCLGGIGDNPNDGYTSFDNFGMAMLNAFQLITLDYWEDPYNKIIRANGPWNLIFFVVVVFFGSFYLINLMLAVVSMSYEEEASKSAQLEEKAKKEKKDRVSNANKIKDGAKKKKEKKNKEDKSETDTNHLQVMAAVTPVNVKSASNISLKSISNGHLKTSTQDLQNTPPEVPVENNVKKPNVKKTEQDSGTGQRGMEGHSQADIQKESDGDGEEGQEKPQPDSIHTTLDSGMGSSEKLVDEVQEIKPNNNQDEEKEDGYINPLVTMSSDDTHSVAESENQGDAPVVIIKDDEDDEIVDRNCECCGKCCTCYIPFLKFQNFLTRIVSELAFELFISTCIGLNVLCMTIEHHNMPKEVATTTQVLNIVFTVIFLLEALMKITALSQHYFRSSWNVFDLLIVIASLVDIGVESIQGLGIIRVFRLLRLLRVFKLAQTWSTMRMLLSICVKTIGALGNLVFILVIVMYIFAVIGMRLFSKNYTKEKFAGYRDDVPRWNFIDFKHSIVLVFRILCGEWIEPLWDCMIVSHELCMVVFLPTLILGNFVVLNLFLAMMLNSFATDALSRKGEEKDGDKMKKGWKKLKGLFKTKSSAVTPQEEELKEKKPSIADIIEELKRQKKAMYEEEQKDTSGNEQTDQDIEMTTLPPGDDVVLDPVPEQNDSHVDTPNNGTVKNKTKEMDEAFKTERNKYSTFAGALSANKKPAEQSEEDTPPQENSNGKASKTLVASKNGDEEDGKSVASHMSATPSGRNKNARSEEEEEEEEEEDSEKNDGTKSEGLEDCFPHYCYARCCECCRTMDGKRWGQRWHNFRLVMYDISEHKAFEYIILLVIILSSITLCFEDVNIDDKPELKQALYYCNIVFVVLFGVEMIVKWFALGFKKYFTSAWTVLDFCIVIISVLSLAAESAGLEGIDAFRSLRTLRALRPLRAISRWQSMRIVVNALMYAIPAIINVFLVCLVFWLIFSIAGVQLFGGKFYKCVDENGEKILNYTLIPNRTVCESFPEYKWKNSKIHFNNVISGYLALFQVATFEGWMEVMEDAVDSVGVDMQPIKENTFLAYVFFIFFIIVGSFFTLNLFIGVIIDNFNMLKKKYEGSYLDAFLTTSQKNYYNTMKKLGNRKPQKTIKRPKNKVQGFFFDVAVSTKFELAIVILILLNMCAMGVEHYNQPQTVTDALDIVNIVFTTIFTLEAIVKITGLRWHYFRRAWNVFDFIIVILSVLGVILDDLLQDIFITPSLLRVVKVFRIGRVLRLIKAAKGIRKLLFALVISLPALFNIGMLLLLIMFIFAILGMTLFGNVKQDGSNLDDITNFETFYSSMVLLLRLTTAAGWNDVLVPLMNEDDCNNTHRIMPDGRTKAVPNGNCASATTSALYFVVYILLTYLIIINMYIAVILENFNQAHEQEEVGVTEDDFEMFYIVWERYDPHATQFIKYDSLPDFVGDLDPPLGIQKPNEIALVAFDLPIMEGDRLHCLDILISLVKHVLGGVEETDEFKQLKVQMEEKYRDTFPTRVTQVQISSTMRRKKEDVAARTLQRAWRKHKAQQSIRKITEMAMEAQLNRSLTRSSFSNPASQSPRRPGSSENSRPQSATSTQSIKASSTAQQKKQLGNTLKVPTANDINPPSDTDLNV